MNQELIKNEIEFFNQQAKDSKNSEYKRACMMKINELEDELKVPVLFNLKKISPKKAKEWKNNYDK